MDQGDFQMPLLPDDFDIDRSLWEDDWSFGCAVAPQPQVSGISEEQPQNPCALSPNEEWAALYVNQRLPVLYQSQEVEGCQTGDRTLSFPVPIGPHQEVGSCWMNRELNLPQVPVTANVPVWTSEFYENSNNVDPSSLLVDKQEQLPLPSWPIERQTWSQPSMLPASYCGVANATPPLDAEAVTEGRPFRSMQRKSGTGKGTPGGNRLVCPYPGCKLTFPRKYELERHRTTVHDCNVSILCSVYGCNRVSKPFPRLDKFYEHVRKHHKGPERFLCILESCRQGPMTRKELVDHLNTQHSLKDSQQPHLTDSLNALGLPGLFRKGEPILLENGNACPLKSLGCDYSHPPNSNGGRLMIHHLQQHQLIDRSDGYETIVAFLGEWTPNGLATCPICKISVSYYFINFFIRHVDLHTMAEIILFAPQLAQAFRPYLAMQEQTSDFGAHRLVLRWNREPEFRARVEESGVLRRDATAPQRMGS